MKKAMRTLDGNEAVASVTYKINEVAAIYPITPSSAMGEWMDQWASEGRKNIWGTVPHVIVMQSEGGAAGTVHGALQTGALTTTFTASQGLLLMLPNMYKIAGELTSTVFHVAARSIAAQALSIFGDHSDVMAVRSSGFAMLASASVQEANDFALISQVATLESRLPFIHFFDGFRTSHEVMKVIELTDEEIRTMMDDEQVRAHRNRSLSPERPAIRGTAQNPDVFFQGRETVNTFYNACPDIVQHAMDKFKEVTGREYKIFEYTGAPDAENVIVIIGSGSEAVSETVEYLLSQDEKVGLLKVRLYRPFSKRHFVSALPKSVKTLSVLDRTKEPGASGEPLYLDVLTATHEAVAEGVAPFTVAPHIIGGRYGLSSKEFTPAMIKGIFDEMKKDRPKNHFTVGINDDVTHSSIEYDANFSTEDPDTVRAVFYGLGSDGTVGANKNSIKIIGESTDHHTQGYFVYDSNKSGAMTISHLRFGPRPIRSSYLITRANFVACHQFSFIEKIDVLKTANEGATFLLNSPYGPNEVWDKLPRSTQQKIIEKKLKFYVIDALNVAREAGLGNRINTVMQTCFFAISGVLPRDEAIHAIKATIEKTYGKRGEAVVKKNWAAVDSSVNHLKKVQVPLAVSSSFDFPPAVPKEAPEFVQNVTAKLLLGDGNNLPVSAMPVDGTFPSGTTQWEKRNIGLELPVWDSKLCTQCGKCSLICPHGVIRAKLYDPELLSGAPEGFKSAEPRSKSSTGKLFTLQMAPEDCTSCTLCVDICPIINKEVDGLKAINMEPQSPIRERERECWNFFQGIPDNERSSLNLNALKDVQLLRPLFEFSGACAGCGETPYIKLITQLFGDRSYVANATGCSSIYGGNLPTTPWSMDANGRGPAWSNSLFEDNAEFGLGMRVALDKHTEYVCEMIKRLRDFIGADLVDAIFNADQSTEAGIAKQRSRIELLKKKITNQKLPEVEDLLNLVDVLVKKSVWIIGGDGWAYDIGYSGLDHVIASGRDVNILVLDNESYSNTGGQCSKATPRAAVAKFALAGKSEGKKDLAMMAMNYGTAYVAQIAMGANDVHTLKVMREAEAYPGPSLIIAYSHCISHGYSMAQGLSQQKAAVKSGHWPLFRYNPEMAAKGKVPFKLDSKEPSIELEEYMYNENRYKMLTISTPEQAEKLLGEAKLDVRKRWNLYKHLATMPTEHN